MAVHHGCVSRGQTGVNNRFCHCRSPRESPWRSAQGNHLPQMHLLIAFHDHRMHKHETQAMPACLGENPDVRLFRLPDAPTAGSTGHSRDTASAGGRQRSGWLIMERTFAFVGCRTTRARNAEGTGISVFEIDPSGGWQHCQTLEPLVNPSFLALSEAQDRLYAVHGDESEVSAYRFDSVSGLLSALNVRSGVGRNPVHVEFSRDGSSLVIAGYATGSLTPVPIASDGSLNSPSLPVVLEGRPGPHRVEQVSSHPHHVPRYSTRFVDSDWYIVPDKGLDTVFAVRWLSDGSSVVKCARAREGAGPRHAAFHPLRPYVYVVNELDSTLTSWLFNHSTGDLTAVNTVSVIPGDYHGWSRAAGIAIAADGRSLYVTNRGHDTIATFCLDPTTCLPTDIAWTPTGGSFPRFLCLGPDGKTLYVANENSHSIVQFLLESGSGRPVATGRRVETGSPVCIVFARFGT
ncbi:lactonase family protein [Burkholderia sp. Bp9142]|nr:lactonase family protein [Burkholderia sp. Bp9142]RQR45972.1 lactonase family protein [Burkholderia sp. Bp9140]